MAGTRERVHELVDQVADLQARVEELEDKEALNNATITRVVDAVWKATRNVGKIVNIVNTLQKVQGILCDKADLTASIPAELSEPLETSSSKSTSTSGSESQNENSSESSESTPHDAPQLNYGEGVLLGSSTGLSEGEKLSFAPSNKKGIPDTLRPFTIGKVEPGSISLPCSSTKDEPKSQQDGKQPITSESTEPPPQPLPLQDG